MPGWVFRYVGNKTFDFSSKKKDFLPKKDQIWPKIGIFGQFGPGHAGLYGALLVGRLVVVARGLYLARHLFTLYKYSKIICYWSTHYSSSYLVSVADASWKNYDYEVCWCSENLWNGVSIISILMFQKYNEHNSEEERSFSSSALRIVPSISELLRSLMFLEVTSMEVYPAFNLLAHSLLSNKTKVKLHWMSVSEQARW